MSLKRPFRHLPNFLRESITQASCESAARVLICAFPHAEREREREREREERGEWGWVGAKSEVVKKVCWMCVPEYNTILIVQHAKVDS